MQHTYMIMMSSDEIDKTAEQQLDKLLAVKYSSIVPAHRICVDREPNHLFTEHKTCGS